MSLVIPAGAWQTVLASLRVPPHDVERVAYLDGPAPSNGRSIVTTVTLPRAEVSEGDFHVSPVEMSRAGKHLRVFGLMRLAQVHTHPSGWTGHSAYDDQMAFSQRDGAISIVVPHFAGCSPGIADCGVHVRDRSGWRELDGAEKGEIVQIVPSLVNLRL